ncbi:hypothetical protein ES703_116466 [subsurface metagenome]
MKREAATRREQTIKNSLNPNRSTIGPKITDMTSIARFIYKNKLPASLLLNCILENKEGNIAPRTAITIPKTNIPAQAEDINPSVLTCFRSI